MEESKREPSLAGKAEAEIAPEPEKAPEIETRPNRFMLRLLRWVLVFLIVFGLGAVLIIVTLYVPAQRRIQQASQRYAQLEDQSQADFDQAEQKIAALELRLKNLTTVEAENQALQSDLDESGLHLVILSARTDVAEARLALAKGDLTKARIALSKTGDTLKSLEEMLEADQRKVVVDMQNQLNSIRAKIDADAEAAEADLVVLATWLLEMENAFFVTP